MGAKYKHEGAAIEYIPGLDIEAGDVVILSGLVGVANHPITSGQVGTLAIEGVFDFPKALSGVTFNQGGDAYWDDSADVAVVLASGNTLIGPITKAAGDGDEFVSVKLSP